MSLKEIIEEQKVLYKNFCFKEIFQEEIPEPEEDLLEENLILLVSSNIRIDDVWFWIEKHVPTSNFLVSPPNRLEDRILSKKHELEGEDYIIFLPKWAEIWQNSLYLNLNLTLLERLLFEIVYPGHLGDQISICNHSLYIDKNFPNRIFVPTLYFYEGHLVLDKILTAG